jgi:hypothetical protein
MLGSHGSNNMLGSSGSVSVGEQQQRHAAGVAAGLWSSRRQHET